MFPLRQIVSAADNIGERLRLIHEYLNGLLAPEGIARISLVTYSNDTGYLSTFAVSDYSDCGFSLYSVPLDKVPSLAELSKTGEPRVIDDVCASYSPFSTHSDAICSAGLKSSLTYPIINGQDFCGFLFLNATASAFFSQAVVEKIAPAIALISLMLANEMAPLKALQAAVDTVREIGSKRDDETGSHLVRMAAYVRLIALVLAKRYKYPDDWVETVVRFAPLHDIGKLTVPDDILHKPGKLDSAEREIMQRHVQSGVDIASMIIENFRIDNDHVKTILRDVIAHHHETLDGNGYPNKLDADSISIEGRIVAVADIFDALTTERVYKAAWPVEKALDYLRSIAGTKLDEECVQIMSESVGTIEDIRRRYGV